MRTRHPIIVIASVLALALAASAVLAASAHATFPGRNGLIAFTANVGGYEQIFVMNPDGSGLRQVNHGTANPEEPSIAPDGKTIVFVEQPTSALEIAAMTTTGTDVRHLATVNAAGVWGDPSFSPDGRHVVFANERQVWVMNADGSHQRRLTALAGAIEGAWMPTYSPDGRTIVFGTCWVGQASPKYRCEILAMNADGTHLRRLAFTTEASYVGGTTWGVSFSPDGKSIVYAAYATAYANTSGEIIRVMNADGSHQRLLPRSYGFRSPCYSPDGRQIVCVNGHHQISVVNANGTHWRQLTHITDGVEWIPNWGPHVR